MAFGDVARFHWADYVVFILAMILSSSIGVYYGIKDKRKKRQNIEDYLMAGRNMTPLPVSVSLFVSWLSAVSMLGDPAEVYYRGSIYWMLGFGYCLAVPAVAEYFAPRYHRLKLFSAFEFLQERFNVQFRVIASVLGGTSSALYAGLVLYAPAISLAQVSGISVWISTIVIGLVCTFYTTLGGIKAVLWADTIQTVIMFAGLLAVVIRGCVVVGGITEVFRIASARGRINFSIENFNPSPLIRSTFWTYLIGGFFRVFPAYLSSQTWIQRYCTLRSEQDARKAVYWNIPMYATFSTMFTLLGLVMVAYYDGCDPLMAGKIEKSDQIVPLFMVELLGFVPGFPGLFLASLFCAALSTMSSSQNSLSVTLLNDIVRPAFFRKWKRDLTEKEALMLSKLFTVLLGIVFIGVALLLMLLKDTAVFPISFKISGCLAGPMAAIFFVGFLFPFVDNLSAYVGFFLSTAICVWWNLGALFSDIAPSKTLPVDTDACYVSNSSLSRNYNVTLLSDVSNSSLSLYNVTQFDDVTQIDTLLTRDTIDQTGFSLEDIYYFSPLLYSALGFFISVIVSVSMGAVRRYLCKRTSSNMIYSLKEYEQAKTDNTTL